MAGSAGVSITAVQGQLTTLVERIRGAARRSWRFSWYSWGVIFAWIGGFMAAFVFGLLFPVVTTTVTANGTSTTTTFPVWVYVFGFIPPLVVLVLAVREVVEGRREGLEGYVPSNPRAPVLPSEGPSGWTEMVRESQQLITHMKNETEISFLPLFIGVLGMSELGSAVMLVPLLGFSYPLSFLWTYLVAVPFLLLLIPLYVSCGRWIRGYQTMLDQQVGGLSRLEAEFFSRFAALAPTQ
jgi:hypothetical protein